MNYLYILTLLTLVIIDVIIYSFLPTTHMQPCYISEYKESNLIYQNRNILIDVQFNLTLYPDFTIEPHTKLNIKTHANVPLNFDKNPQITKTIVYNTVCQSLDCIGKFRLLAYTANINCQYTIKTDSPLQICLNSDTQCDNTLMMLFFVLAFNLFVLVVPISFCPIKHTPVILQIKKDE